MYLIQHVAIRLFQWMVKIQKRMWTKVDGRDNWIKQWPIFMRLKRNKQNTNRTLLSSPFQALRSSGQAKLRQVQEIVAPRLLVGRSLRSSYSSLAFFKPGWGLGTEIWTWYRQISSPLPYPIGYTPFDTLLTLTHWWNNLLYLQNSCNLVFGFSYHYSLSWFVLIHKNMIWLDAIKNLQCTNLVNVRL